MKKEPARVPFFRSFDCAQEDTINDRIYYSSMHLTEKAFFVTSLDSIDIASS